MIRPLISVAIALCTVYSFSGTATAKDVYPNRSVSLIVPFPAGGATDVLGRVIAHKLAQELGQSVVVENRGGAGTIIGATSVARAPADGYTLLISSGTTFTVNPAIREKLGYDPIKSFEPIGIVGRTSLVLLANTQVPVQNLKDLQGYVRQSPSAPPAYGSFGSGTIAQFVAEDLFAAAGLKLTHVPYKGSTPAMTDLIGGQIPLSVDTVSAALPHLKQGKVKAIAVFSPERSTFMPNVATVGEQGYPQVAMDSWLMLAVPRGVPSNVKDRLEAALRQTMDDPQVKTALRAQACEPTFVPPAEAEAQIKKELPLMRAIAKRANITAD